MSQPGTTTDTGRRQGAGGQRAAGLLAGMRIRKKLVFLHTCFSLALAAILILAMRPAIGEVVRRAESHEAAVLLRLMLAGQPLPEAAVAGGGSGEPEWRVVRGDEAVARLGPGVADRARNMPGRPVANTVAGPDAPSAVAWDPGAGGFVGVAVRLAEARRAVVTLYVLVIAALLAVYGLVALALEMFVLPQHVYGPIRALLAADRSLRAGRREGEIIPERQMPADELGEIMRSRNESVRSLRRHEAELASALLRLEEALTDLRRKNHMLETAKRNLADADRLASLGIMSAGIAHELNTPLAVLKGLVEKLNSGGGEGGGGGLSRSEAELMLRVVRRLEGLSESLLDFSRVRTPKTAPTRARSLVDEAWTLVRLDRQAAGRVDLANRVPDDVVVECDSDRILQVLVNLLRNSVDVMDGRGHVEVESETMERDGRRWISVTIRDSGPGIDPGLLGTLFEPFVSTRLDSRGTGLGLAVAEGIVREHGGLLLARNRTDGASGAVFEMVLPLTGGTVEESTVVEIGDR